MAYAWAAVFVSAALAIDLLMARWIAHPPHLMAFIPAVALSARFGGKGPGLFAVVASALIVDYLFIPPTYELVPTLEALPRFITFLIAAFVATWLAIPPEKVHERRAVAPVGAPAASPPETLPQIQKQQPARKADAALDAISEPHLRALRAKKILIMGLPGAGKTTLARALVPRLNAVHFNGDAVRANLNSHLGFSHPDRVEQARRMGWLCDCVVATGTYAIADFICPTEDTREGFGDAFIVWVDRIQRGAYADTNAMFKPPAHYDVHVTAEGSPSYWTEKICEKLLPKFNPQAPTALFIGRYQPFHDGHKALIEEGLRRVGQVCIMVRDTHGTDEKNPLDFHAVKARIESALWEYRGRVLILSLPNITNVFYGRDVGYTVEQLTLDKSLEQISATNIRRELRGG